MIKRPNQGELKNNEGILYAWLMDADSGSGALDSRWDLRPSEGKIINSDGILYTLLLDAKNAHFQHINLPICVQSVEKEKKSQVYCILS